MNCALIILDGIGDRPINAFRGKTPLEYAKTPNLDRLARGGICGLMHPSKFGVTCGSDTSHLSLFGLDPQKYYFGRGPLEALGANIKLEQGDVAFRANLASVDEKLFIKDRRTGRIESTADFCKKLDGINIDGVKVIVKPSVWYRACVVLRGRGISDAVSETDPKREGVRPLVSLPLDKSNEAKKTGRILNEFTKRSYDVLNPSGINSARRKRGLLPGNMFLLRGAGKFHKVPSIEDNYGMRSACIAGGGLYKGIARYLGMDVIDVKGATGRYDSDFNAKAAAANKALDSYDLVYVHMKATDSASEDGNAKLKVQMVERMDKAIGKIRADVIIVTGDHSTPCELKRHSYEPVPFLMNGKGVRVDGVKSFGERSCMQGGLGHICGLDIMPLISAHCGFSKLYGA